MLLKTKNYFSVLVNSDRNSKYCVTHQYVTKGNRQLNECPLRLKRIHLFNDCE